MTDSPGAVFRSTQQEEFTLAYVYSVAAAAGVGVTIHVQPDIDGIDVAFAGYTGKRARLEAQVKSYVHDPALSEPTIPYDRDVGKYEKLRIETLTPRMLILVTLPKEIPDWCAHTEEGFRLHRCGYFLNLAGAPETKKQEHRARPRAASKPLLSCEPSVSVSSASAMRA